MSKMHDEEYAPTITAKEFDVDDKKTAISVFSDCHTALFGYLIISSIAAVIIAVPLTLIFSLGTDIIPEAYISPLLQVICMYVIAFPLFCVTVKKLPTAQRDKSTIKLGEFFSLFAIALAMMQIGSLISTFATKYLNSVFSLPAELEMTYALLQVGNVLPTVLWVVILAPIFEEFIFRKILIDRLSIYGDRLAVIVTAVAFGLFHGNITQFFYATLAGIVLGHVYTKTRRISYSIIIHMLVNLFGTLPTVLYYAETGIIPEESIDVATVLNGEVTPLYIVVVLQSLIVIFGLFMTVFSMFSKKYRLSRKCDIEIPKLKLIRVVLLNKGTVLFFIYSVLTILSSYILLAG